MILTLLIHVLLGASLPGHVTAGVSRIWPLVPELPNAEVKDGGTLIKEACGFGECDGHPNLDYSGVKFYGTDTSYLDLYHDDSDTYSVFSFTVALSNPLPEEGVIFQYKHLPIDPLIPSLHEIQLVKNSTHFRFTVENDVNDVYEFSAALDDVFPTTLGAAWLLIGVTYDKNGDVSIVSPEVELLTQNDVWSDNNDNLKLGVPGTLRLASSLDQTEVPYAGGMTCVQVWSNEIRSNDLEKELLRCRMDDWIDLMPSFTKEINTCPSSGVRYRRQARDSSPNSAVIMAITQPSKILCAGDCNKTEGCHSFTHDGTTCRLFNTTVTWGLNDTPGREYFIKANVCC